MSDPHPFDPRQGRRAEYRGARTHVLPVDDPVTFGRNIGRGGAVGFHCVEETPGGGLHRVARGAPAGGKCGQIG